MTCCEPFILPFANADVVHVTYTTAMKNAFGDIPTLHVYHKNSNNEYMIANIQVGFIGFPATEIRVYNGGPASGYIKISK